MLVMNFDSRCWGVAAAVLLSVAGCDKGSVGEFGETEGATGSSSTGAGSASASSTGSSTTPGTASASATATGSGETSGAPLLDVGVGGLCAGNDAHQCAAPVDCGESCGELDSMLDEDGCVRQACGTSSDCGAGFFCYRPSDYGGCQSSHIGCVEDEDGMCGCGLDDDCGGAYCVPEDIVFGGITPGPTQGFAVDLCGPDDGPGFTIELGSDASNACGGAFDPGPLLTINGDREAGTTGTFISQEGTWVEAWYAADGVMENADIAQWVVLRITAWGDTVEGNYEVLLPDETLLVGSFSTVVSCEMDPPLPCG
jgi:hypothetical protein